MSAGDLNFDPKNANSAPPGAERETLGEEWVGSVSALAEKLGVDRKTIQRWTKLAGCPGKDEERGFHVARWQEFGAQVGKKTKLPDKAEAELQGILVKNERARLELEKERGNLLEAEQVAELVAGMAHAFANRLAGSRHSLGPMVVGLAVPEATKRIGIEHHHALAELAVPDWAKKKVGAPGRFWSKVFATVSGLLLIENLGDGPRSTLLSPQAP